MQISPGFEAFAAAYDAGKPSVVWTRLVTDMETPVSAMLKLADGLPYSFLLESVEGGSIRGRYSLIGFKPDLIWRCDRGKAEINRQARQNQNSFEPIAGNAMDSLRALIRECRIDMPAELPPMASGLFGYMGYDMVRLMERIPDNNPDPLGIPDSTFMRPTVMVVFDRLEDAALIITPVWPTAGMDARTAYAQAQERLSNVLADFRRSLPYRRESSGTVGMVADAKSNVSKQQFMDMVVRAKEYIAAGDAFQIVPSQRYALPFNLPPFALYRTLRRINPTPFLIYFDFGNFSIVGSSPEILVRLREDWVTVRPLAGTRPRGATPVEDKKMADELLADPKERAEHLMLLDLARNDVGRVAKIGSVRVTEQYVIERNSHVMHISSNVDGIIDPKFEALDALIAGFPAGTLSGAPKVRAMEIIDELEPERRGIYGGCAGYFAANGTMDTCILLRTALIKDGVMYVQSGVGVVADSDPEAEYQESVNKAKALMRAAEEAFKQAMAE
ncbi:MAG: anthranilate synthase component [Alphaproteobacteria bacterium]|nr:anthranilate synthase component [Alphaproteobacteria bacterium]